jgi:predicted nucleic acid-binding Zn ribbon protein
MMDQALSVCPKEKCAQKTWGKGKLKRMIGAGAGFILKGSGFYINDYRSKSYKDGAKKESTASSPSASDSKSSSTASASSSSPAKAGKTESKPAKT